MKIPIAEFSPAGSQGCAPSNLPVRAAVAVLERFAVAVRERVQKRPRAGVLAARSRSDLRGALRRGALRPSPAPNPRGARGGDV